MFDTFSQLLSNTDMHHLTHELHTYTYFDNHNFVYAEYCKQSEVAKIIFLVLAKRENYYHYDDDRIKNKLPLTFT